MDAKSTIEGKICKGALDDLNLKVKSYEYNIDHDSSESGISSYETMSLDSKANSVISDTDSCESALHSLDLVPVDTKEHFIDEDSIVKAAMIAKYSELYGVLNDLFKKTKRIKEQNKQLREETADVNSYMIKLMEAASVLEPLKKF